MRYTRAQIVDGTGFEPDALFEPVSDYNGWTNRETWAVALWINNEQGWQESLLDELRAYLSDRLEKESSEPDIYAASDNYRAYQAGEIVKDSVETILLSDDLGDDADTLKFQRTVLSDIGSLYRVNWDELGAAFLSDVAEASE